MLWWKSQKHWTGTLKKRKESEVVPSYGPKELDK